MSRLRTAYFITANTAILLLAADAGTETAVKAYRPLLPVFEYEQLSEPARRNYAHMTVAAAEDLWRIMLTLRVRYSSAHGFVEEAQRSRFLNIDTRGGRSNGNRPWDLENAIWFFGGSTRERNALCAA